MSEMSRGPVAVQESLPVPAVPAPVPVFREAVPTGPRTGPHFVPTGPLPPPLGGDRGPGRISRRASLALHDCSEHVLTGLDDEPCGMTVRVDPYPLSSAGEVAALREGLRTYWLRHGCLERRNRWNIPGQPPSPDRLVLAEHRCGTRPPEDWLAPLSPRPPRPAPAEGMPF